MANADSATNILWLVNHATAGSITNVSASAPAPAPTAGAAPAEEKKEGILAAAGKGDTSFDAIKIDMNA